MIDGENCKIPNLSPFSTEVMSFYKRLKYQKCHELNPLTYVEQDANLTRHLMINREEKPKYLSWYQNEIQVRVFNSKRENSEDN